MRSQKNLFTVFFKIPILFLIGAIIFGSFIITRLFIVKANAEIICPSPDDTAGICPDYKQRSLKLSCINGLEACQTFSDALCCDPNQCIWAESAPLSLDCHGDHHLGITPVPIVPTTPPSTACTLGGHEDCGVHCCDIGHCVHTPKDMCDNGNDYSVPPTPIPAPTGTPIPPPVPGDVKGAWQGVYDCSFSQPGPLISFSSSGPLIKSFDQIKARQFIYDVNSFGKYCVDPNNVGSLTDPAVTGVNNLVGYCAKGLTSAIDVQTSILADKYLPFVPLSFGDPRKQAWVQWCCPAGTPNGFTPNGNYTSVDAYCCSSGSTTLQSDNHMCSDGNLGIPAVKAISAPLALNTAPFPLAPVVYSCPDDACMVYHGKDVLEPNLSLKKNVAFSDTQLRVFAASYDCIPSVISSDPNTKPNVPFLSSNPTYYCDNGQLVPYVPPTTPVGAGLTGVLGPSSPIGTTPNNIQITIDPRFATVMGIISILSNILFPVIGLLLFAMIVYGGATKLSAAGDAEKEKKAMQILKNAIIGAVIVVLAVVIVNTVSSLLTTSFK